MKTIIAGSRTITDYSLLMDVLDSVTWEITEVISGGARGVDRLGEQYANKNNIPIKRFPAQWTKYGKRAGFLRNKEMAEYADALIAVWDGESKGTQHMLNLAKQNNLRTIYYRRRN